MVTRFRVRTNRPNERLNFHVSLVSLLPKSYCDAFNDPNWQNAMRDEYTALIKNKTWTLVPRPPDTNIVRCMWLFCHKNLADGMLSRYKARLVENGSTQLEGVHVDETFSSVLKLAVSLWAQEIPSGSALHLILLRRVFLIVARIIGTFHQEFAMTDLGHLNDFLGISITRDSSGLFLSQKKYAIEILKKAYIISCNHSRTPIDTVSKLGVDGDPVSDPNLYRSLAGSIQYLTFTRPDISYIVQQVFLHMHDPREPHLFAFKRILCKRQPTLSRSSAEAEYRGVDNAVAKTCWLRNLLRELHTSLSSATL
nr:ribonuclease H-like domain-containing protein [Tanacetum cinerariifolium]